MSVWKRVAPASTSRAPLRRIATRFAREPDLRIPRARLGLRLHRLHRPPRRRQRSTSAYGGEDERRQYHSIYDDFYWYTHFSDTDFRLRTRAGADGRHRGDAHGRRGYPALPVRRSRETVKTYLAELKKLEADQRDEIEERNRRSRKECSAPRRSEEEVRSAADGSVPPRTSTSPRWKTQSTC